MTNWYFYTCFSEETGFNISGKYVSYGDSLFEMWNPVFWEKWKIKKWKYCLLKFLPSVLSIKKTGSWKNIIQFLQSCQVMVTFKCIKLRKGIYYKQIREIPFEPWIFRQVFLANSIEPDQMPQNISRIHLLIRVYTVCHSSISCKTYINPFMPGVP